jgi:hypothetical protein
MDSVQQQPYSWWIPDGSHGSDENVSDGQNFVVEWQQS